MSKSSDLHLFESRKSLIPSRSLFTKFFSTMLLYLKTRKKWSRCENKWVSWLFCRKKWWKLAGITVLYWSLRIWVTKYTHGNRKSFQKLVIKLPSNVGFLLKVCRISQGILEKFLENFFSLEKIFLNLFISLRNKIPLNLMARKKFSGE